MIRLKNILLTAAMVVLSGSLFAQKVITGTVYDSNHKPIMGASVSVEGTDIMTLTRTDGTYTISVPEEYEMNPLVVRYVDFPPRYLFSKNVSDVVFEIVHEKTNEEMVVSTQKRLQTAVEVPISLTAFDQAKLDELNTTQIDEISYFVPGFTNIIQGQNKAGYSIRGVTSDGMESFFQPRISVFLNGVTVSREQVSAIEPYDLERIEIVRGPQGTLFGRGAEIGAVHFITKRPEKTFSGHVTGNYGGYSQYGIQGYVNVPINEKFADRFALKYDYHDGYIENLAGGKLNGRNTIALRNTLGFYPKANSKFNLILDFQSDNNPGVCFKSQTIAPDGGDTSPFTAAYLNGGDALGLKRNLFGLTLEYEHDFNSSLGISNIFGARTCYADEYFDGDGTYLYILDAQETASQYQLSEEFRLNWNNGDRLSGFVGAGAMYDYCEHTMVTKSNLNMMFPASVGPVLRAEFEKSFAVLPESIKEGIDQYKAVLSAQYPAYSDMISQALDAYTDAVCPQIATSLNEQLDVWFKDSQWATSPDFAGDTKNIISGILINTLNGMMQQNPQISALLGGMTAEQVVGGMGIEDKLAGMKAYSGLTLSPDYEENHTNITRNFETDVFADVSWNVMGNLYLTLGLRGTYEKQKTGYLSNSDPSPFPSGENIIYQNTDGVTYWIEDDNFSWVGRCIINYMINNVNNIYLSFAKGRRPGVVYFNYNPNDSVILRPEAIFSLEFGAKGNLLHNTLSYAASFYAYNWLHFQSNVAYVDEQGKNKYKNNDKGRAQCYGVEASLKYTFPRYLSLFADYTYFDGKFADKDEDGNELELAGHSFRLSSKHAFDCGLNVEVPFKERYTAYFRPNYSYKSKLYFEDSNREDISQEGCGILNATLGVYFTKRNMSYDFGLWAKNITDTQYLIDAGNAGEQIGFPTFVAGAPANVGFRVAIGFK
ncbi:MAG: TonB-dependent receptor [Bacteroidales bacterium]|nr:TonB-dependent receptor [Bacteroidales bacterium]